MFWSDLSAAEIIETIQIYSEPKGAECTLSNDKNNLKIITTKTVRIKWSRKKLDISCSYPGHKTVNEKLSLKRKKDLPSFDFDITQVVGIKQIYDVSQAACFGAAVAKNPLHDVVCMGLDAVALGIISTGNVIKKGKALISKKTLSTHTYANSKIKGVKSIVILLYED